MDILMPYILAKNAKEVKAKEVKAKEQRINKLSVPCFIVIRQTV